jgi:hypothetical protein
MTGPGRTAAAAQPGPARRTRGGIVCGYCCVTSVPTATFTSSMRYFQSTL